MRAGPLSNDKVIDTLNRYFVPVFISNEDYHGKGAIVSQAEQDEYQRIFREFGRRKMTTGTVHVYLLSPDGQPIESMHVAQASHTDRLMAMLQRCIAKLGTRPGEALVKPRDTSVAPAGPLDALVLHLVSRGQNTGPQGGSWREFPAENWIVLPADQCHGLLPPQKPAQRTSYDVNPSTAASIFRYFYPQSEDPSDQPWTRIDAQSLRATVVRIRDGIATARLEGAVRLERNFYPGKFSPEHVSATVLGFVTWHIDEGRITSLRLVTDDARCNKEPFAVAVNAAP